MESKLEISKPPIKKVRDKSNENILRVIKGSIIAIVITLVALLIYASLLTYTNLSESTIVPVVITISGVSILIGSSISSLKIKKQGMLNGALVGLIYMLTIYILSSIIFAGFAIDMKSVIMLMVGTLAGMIGGIIGVNI